MAAAKALLVLSSFSFCGNRSAFLPPRQSSFVAIPLSDRSAYDSATNAGEENSPNVVTPVMFEEK